MNLILKYKLYFSQSIYFLGVEVCDISVCAREHGAHSVQHPHATGRRATSRDNINVEWLEICGIKFL